MSTTRLSAACCTWVILNVDASAGATIGFNWTLNKAPGYVGYDLTFIVYEPDGNTGVANVTTSFLTTEYVE